MKNQNKNLSTRFQNWDKCTECLENTKGLHNNITMNNLQVVGRFEYLCDECYGKRKRELGID